MVNVPLIQGNSIQEINTSIIAIKKAQKELEALNTLVDKKIKALNLALSGGSGKYIESISQTQGLIEVTEGSITDTVASGNNSPVTSNGVADIISKLNVESIGTTSFKARGYTEIANNTEYEFADIQSISDGVTALVSICTTSVENVCQSLWLVTVGNYTCGITLLAKSGYGSRNATKLTVNYSLGGTCNLTLRLTSSGSYVNNKQSGYISILCMQGRAVLKEKTTSITSRPRTQSYTTNLSDYNQIATDTVINATVDQSRKNLPLMNIQNDSGNVVYYKISGLLSTSLEMVYLLQAREGELLVISTGHGDSSTYATPKIKRLLDKYTKVTGFTRNGSNIYMRIAGYSHEVILTQLAGDGYPSISITNATSTEYNSGTAITIET